MREYRIETSNQQGAEKTDAVGLHKALASTLGEALIGVSVGAEAITVHVADDAPDGNGLEGLIADEVRKYTPSARCAEWAELHESAPIATLEDAAKQIEMLRRVVVRLIG
jgi:hypothetical protein